ncbi:MAG: type I DNA topoisomerase [Oscillospiraceae bacterium]|nr:type I DNA topoisomerase [Oscillospiraceae bacterium]
MSNLVIVESPAKARTIQKYLGKDFSVIASMGHIRDLPKSKLGIDVENGFAPMYQEIKGKEELIAELKSAAEQADTVYLATDPDREGEAISWHLAYILGLSEKEKNRVTFNEITKSGVQNGMAAPREIDKDLVDAQQARRLLDRIVGYKLSPFLWKKVRRGLSAGRVQSVAVRLISDREEQIRKFKAEEYWTVDAKLKAKSSRKAFEAALALCDGAKIALANEQSANDVLKEIENAKWTVETVKKSVRRRQPAPPFITSTLQQEASRKLGFQPRRTMKVAQELYEGVDVADYGTVGLITYMRTDSLRISDEAAASAEQYIKTHYTEKYLPSSRRVYKSKKNAQDAHEAIRPSVPELTPDQVKSSLSAEQYKLYKLVWERFIASQMAACELETVSVDIAAGRYTFKANGYTVKFDGFTVLYEESREEGAEKATALPALNEGEELKKESVAANQHFTQPPARYSEASLIKALEENGIGRPSTYAPTISTIIDRGYVERSGKLLIPTSLGDTVTGLLKDQFKSIVDVKFTAGMEGGLDRVESGDQDWIKMLEEFYADFSATLSTAEKNMEGKRVKVPDEETDEVCELCGRKMVVKIGRFGKFLACPGYPECKNTKKIVQKTGGTCPKCGGEMLAKKSKKGRGFYGCGNYPNCDFMTWDKPLPEKCPKCGSGLFKKAGRYGGIRCHKEGCGYERAADKN